MEGPAPRRGGRRAAVLAGIAAIAVVLFGGVEPEHGLPIQAGALLLGAGAVMGRLRRGEPPLPCPSVTFFVLLLTALPALQLVPLPAGAGNLLAPGLARFGVTHLRTLSTHPSATVFSTLRWLSYAAFFIAALDTFERPGGIPSALTVLALLGLLEALYGIGNLMAGNDRLLWLPRGAYLADATGTLVNRNHFAATMEVCLPALLARRWFVRRQRSPAEEHALTAIFVLGAAVGGLAVLLSHSRGGIASLAIALSAVLLLTRQARTGGLPRGVLVGLALLTLVYGIHAGLDPVLERFQQLADTDEGRLALWRDTLALVRDFPVMGAGAGAFETIFPAYRQHAGDQFIYSHAHQDYLEVAAEGGTLALVLMLIAAINFTRRLSEGFARTSGRRCLALALLSGATVGPLLHALVDFPLHIPGIVMLVLLVSAATLCLANSVALPQIPDERRA